MKDEKQFLGIITNNSIQLKMEHLFSNPEAKNSNGNEMQKMSV